jgi:hypothetical protein
MPQRRKPLSPAAREARPGGLARTATLTTRTRLKPRSDKTARKYVTRRVIVGELLAARPWCEIRWDGGCESRSTDVHEPRMRSRGADICDPAQCVAACRYCHGEVHGHPAEATKRGWLIPSWEAVA